MKMMKRLQPNAMDLLAALTVGALMASAAALIAIPAAWGIIGLWALVTG